MNPLPVDDNVLVLDPVHALQLDASIGPLSLALTEILKKRRTERAFSRTDLPRMQLSRLLWAAFGCNGGNASQRTAPKNSEAQGIDLYVILPSGHYRFDAESMCLLRQGQRDLRQWSGEHRSVLDAPVSIAYVARVCAESRQAAALGIGHISQNVYLFCAAEGLAAYAHTDFDHVALRAALGLGDDQDLMLVQSVGLPAVPRASSEPGYDE